jgi:hypothetical protein
VFPNARGALLGEKYRLAMETRTYQSFETAYRDDRFEKWYDVRIYPAEDGLSVFFQDITEKKRDQRQKEIMVRSPAPSTGEERMTSVSAAPKSGAFRRLASPGASISTIRAMNSVS